MPTGRYAASALNIGPPEEYLVVAGGINREGKKTTAVEVLVENQWSSIQPLPYPMCNAQLSLHNGYLYLMGGDYHYTAMYCKLDSLLAGTSGLAEGSLWRLFESCMFQRISNPVSFGRNLVTIHGTDLHSDIITMSVTPTGDLIVIGEDHQSKLTLFEASLRSKFITNDTKNHTGAW